jgi:hypothetical protein
MAAAAVGKRVLDTGWLAARFTEVALTGVQLTTTQPPAADPDPAAPWIHAAVPGTYVLVLFPLTFLLLTREGPAVACRL